MWIQNSGSRCGSRIQGLDVDPEFRVQVWIQNTGSRFGSGFQGPDVDPESRVQMWIQNPGSRWGSRIPVPDVDPESRVQVWIQNQGPGMDPESRFQVWIQNLGFRCKSRIQGWIVYSLTQVNKVDPELKVSSATYHLKICSLYSCHYYSWAQCTGSWEEYLVFIPSIVPQNIYTSTIWY